MHTHCAFTFLFAPLEGMKLACCIRIVLFQVTVKSVRLIVHKRRKHLCLILVAEVDSYSLIIDDVVYLRVVQLLCVDLNALLLAAFIDTPPCY